MPKKPPARKRSVALEKYHAKRDFTKTREPTTGRRSKDRRLFVVQEHHARSHHFDFRLEMDGTLASWAVPKGIPEDPEEKRLAVHVEDHPIGYADFEGNIPEGNYGAGHVAIWDRGTWEPLHRNWRKEYEQGKLEFALNGSRLAGAYVLVRMKEEPNWLMRKIVKEGLPLPDLEKETPGFISPQLAKVVPAVPAGKEWLHEIKLDGYRLIAVRKKKEVRLFTRTGLDWTDRFGPLAKDLSKLPGGDFILDGEAVVHDGKGRTRFGALQEALKTAEGKGIVFVAFDILHADGVNLRPLPLVERLKHLEKLIPGDTGVVRRSNTWPGPDGPALFKEACKLGLEGIISKRAGGRYHAGLRRDWVKSKSRPRQEFVICGYTPPKGSCPAFGALVLGSFDGGKLIPRGKVGTGFTDGRRRELLQRMKPLAKDKPPFLFPEKHVTWIRPELVAEIEFAELTADGSIRQGSFISLREDKAAVDVHLDAIQKATADAGDLNIMNITITHPERVVFPDDGITKLEVARFYERVGKLMLPYVRNRPLAILRAPDSIGGQVFFQKSFKTHVPDHVHTKTLEDGTEIFYVKDLKGIISLAQFGMVEIHPWGAAFPNLDKPDQIIWDLDPDSAVPWKETLGAAFLLRDFLAERGLETMVKTSGGKGLHVILPLKRVHGWDVIKPFSKAVAGAIAEFNPKRFVVTASKQKRSGKIYIDWLRNGKGATCVVPWGLRARATAPVSTPVNWDDLADVAQTGFHINEPFSLPEDWKGIKPQSVTKKHMAEFGL
ncbi:DNA ligase D [Luteolibacter sp. SL250]|uniref:DNA ligase D n=1 Tax=Luteolibacter sp. SL250 TaxID=2995170 RepID=UPI00226F2A6C|nr:DNA ligase D [Luteolibacter sp. SL250]WAC21719.1 DNA ligase D [Luteolibacter sp. SL250]